MTRHTTQRKYQKAIRAYVDNASQGTGHDFKVAGGADSSVDIADFFSDTADSCDYSCPRG